MKTTTLLTLLMTTPTLLFGANVEQFLDRDGLGGSLWGFRQDLDNKGILITGGYDGEIWSNTHGGIKTGTKLLGLAYFGTEFDLGTLAGLEGTSIHADGLWYEGTQPTETLVGADSASNVSGTEAGSNFWRFYQIYVQQQIGSDISARVGQLAADETFMGSEYGGLFLNAQFGALPTLADNVNAPIYPLPGPGIYGEWTPEESPWFARVGLYTADVGNDDSHNIGFGWKLGGGVGGILFAEGGRNIELMGQPGTATLGIIGSNVEMPNYESGQTDRGFYSFYCILDQALTLREDGSPKLAAFTRFAYNPQSERSQQVFYCDGGLNLFEPIPTRVDDIAGIAFGCQHYYGWYRSSMEAAGEPITGTQTVLEVTYQASILKWIQVQPDFQVIFDPEFSGRDAYVVGMRASVIF